MDTRSFRNLLVRVLIVPVAALTVLAILLGSALRQVNETARRVDRSDRVIAAAYDLNHLIVDQETGLRGYMASRDKSFLAPFVAADPRIASRFDALQTQLADNPTQAAAARQIRSDYEIWRRQQAPVLANLPSQAAMESTLLRQKAGMDQLRGEWDSFLARENAIRLQRNDWASRVDSMTLFAIIFLSLCILGIIMFSTGRTFLKLSQLYQDKLQNLESARRDSHQRQQWLQTVLRSIGDAVIACDAAGNVTFVNAIAEQLTGWNEFEAVGLPVSKIFVILREGTREPADNPVDTARSFGVAVRVEEHVLLVRKDGSEITVDESAAPIRDPDSELLGAVLVFRDVTEKRQQDRALMRAERLASAGRLSASIAHEVNNPLEGLINLLYIARRLDNLEETQELIAKAELEVGRVAHITRQALGFYKDTTALSEFSVTEIVKQVVSFYSSRAMIDHVTLESRIAENVTLKGSAGEVQQVLSNLLANSLDATPPHGKIRVSLFATSGARAPGGGGARIFVADTGCGISREGMARMFDAFYTTKETSGTGLGLWVTKQLTEKHGGKLRVRSCCDGPKTGTVFSIFLPAVSILSNTQKQIALKTRG